MGLEDTEHVAFPMVCFCDIPLSRVDDHVRFYGNFGVGLTKEWALSNGLMPLHYIARNTQFSEAFAGLSNIIDQAKDSSSGRQYLRSLISFMKPIDGTVAVGSDLIPKEFIQESEWRYVPQDEAISDYLSKDEFEDSHAILAHNSVVSKVCLLRFTPKDVKYIFVEKDSDIPAVINFINEKLDTYPSADLKVLMSRVTSLESIENDL